MAKEIYRGNIRRGRSQRPFSDQIENVLKKARVRSEKNRRVCVKRLMNVSDARGLRFVRIVQSGDR